MATLLQFIIAMMAVLYMCSSEPKLPTGQYLLAADGEVMCQLAGSNENVRLQQVPVLTVKHFKNAVIAYPTVGRRKSPSILIELTPEGQRLFYEFTAKHVGSSSGTAIDGRLYTAIPIHTALPVTFLDVEAQVSKREIKRLVDVLKKEIKANQP